MKKRFRTFIAAATGLALCACANPYVNQIAELDARYAAGNISRSKYLAQRHELEVQKAQVDRENAHLALGAASVATQIAGVAVAADNHGGPGGPGGGFPKLPRRGTRIGIATPRRVPPGLVGVAPHAILTFDARVWPQPSAGVSFFPTLRTARTRGSGTARARRASGMEA